MEDLWEKWELTWKKTLAQSVQHLTFERENSAGPTAKRNLSRTRARLGFPAEPRLPFKEPVSLGDFRVAFRLSFKASPSVKPFIWKLVLFTRKFRFIYV